MHRKKHGFVLFVLSVIVLAGLRSPAARAATPPSLVNYQGVLRNAGNTPLTGAYSMTFVFWSVATGGDEIMLDAHNGAVGSPLVQVTNGMFSVALGSGQTTDGAGPGTITSVADVFRFYGTVWLEVRIGAETLTPRTQILAAAYAENAGTLEGKRASEFLDTSSTAQSKTGRLTIDDASSTPGYGVTINSAGSASVLGEQKTASGVGYLGIGDIGVWGAGNNMGGYFQSANASGNAYLGYGNVGIQGNGRVAGGTFTQSDGHGYAYLGQNGTGGSFYSSGNGYAALASGDYGIVASGTWPTGAGGSFSDAYYGGSAYCGYGDSGIVASGTYQGGEFYDSDGSGHAHLGYGAIGVYGIGNSNEDYLNGGGGYFQDVSGSGKAWVGQYNYGIQAVGSSVGAHFSNSYGSEALLPYGATGLVASGPTTGGYYSNFYGMFANLAYWNGSSAYTIQGNGAKSFVQNHPFDTGKSVVFVALEGDEAGTYTRGQGRLQGGVARVALSPSFGLVTNPDVGLTATITPRGSAITLAIDSLTTDEMVVRAPAGAEDVVFDYTVFGLRLGFESMPIVQPRVDEALLPTVAAARLDAAHPVAGSAFARFAAMRTETGNPQPLDLSRGEALKAAVGIAKEGPPPDHSEGPGNPRRKAPEGGAQAPGLRPQPVPVTGPGASSPAAAMPAGAGTLPAVSLFPAATVPVTVEAEVRGGDVLAIRAGSGAAVAAQATEEAGTVVLGIVAGDPDEIWRGEAPLALGGSIVSCRVDASGGSIAIGDLLTPSAVPGQARRAAAGENGPIIGKALASFTEGHGVIRVLAVAR